MSSENKRQSEEEFTIPPIMIRPDEFLTWFTMSIEGMVNGNDLQVIQQNLIGALAESTQSFSKPSDISSWTVLLFEAIDKWRPQLLERSQEIREEMINDARRKLQN